MAVLTYFHGGGFFRGSGNYEYRTPDSMMKQDIILVTVNYRLGTMGKSERVKCIFFGNENNLSLFFPNRIP